MTETQLQAKVFQHCNNMYRHLCYVFAVPNGGTRNPVEAMTMKATGTRAGVSDLIFLFPEGRSVFMELKTETGKQSDAQIAFEKRVIELGFNYHVCRNFEESIAVVTSYL